MVPSDCEANGLSLEGRKPTFEESIPAAGAGTTLALHRSRDGACSIPFDRAASFYDATRGFPPLVAQEIAAGLLRLPGLTAGQRLLELGVGSGRVALPLARLGLQVVGIDLSAPMLRRLRDKDPSRGVGLVRGDIVTLPFATATFEALLGVHVFHLVGGWRQALAEAMRVLRPGGAFLLGWSQRSADSPLSEVRRRWREIVVARGGRVGRPGERDPRRIIAALAELGAEVRTQETIAAWAAAISPAEAVRRVAQRVYSDAWAVPQALHQASLRELGQWVERRYADPEEEMESTTAFHLAVLRH